MSAYPISNACPQCNGLDYQPRAPKGYIAFVNDRVCTACNTRYTPPTPAWASMVFILIGLVFVVGCALGLIILLPNGKVLEAATSVVGIGFGVLAMGFGIRGLARRGR